MSTSNPQAGKPPTPPPAAPTPPSAAPASKPVGPPQKRQIFIVSHSTLFYWWPVWAFGFLMFIISILSGQDMAIVPRDSKFTEVLKDREGKPKKDSEKVTIDGFDGPRQVVVLPIGENAATTKTLHISGSKNVGVVFVAILLLVIVITNIPLRGLWSFIVILFIIFFTIIFSIMEWWAIIFDIFTLLDIRINAAGYLVISSILFILWLVVFFLFDRQIYMIFEPGQMRVRQAIGDAETSYDTTGMTTMKQRGDLFRHWILGLGSGDLIVRTSGAHPVEIHMNNVLFIGGKHEQIEELLRSREVVAGD